VSARFGRGTGGSSSGSRFRWSNRPPTAPSPSPREALVDSLCRERPRGAAEPRPRDLQWNRLPRL